jgi:ABC-2 type transport system ATP-binding protein
LIAFAETCAHPARGNPEDACMLLTIEAVSKTYGRHTTALADVSLELAPGVVGLLGPNGAGKSTLMRILATISHPSKGRVGWNGVDIAGRPNELRRVLGYLPQDFGVYPNLTAREFLAYLAAVRGLAPATATRRIDELLALVNLTDVRDRPLGSFSGGMRQRVGIAQALLNDPELLIVDEPTVGLDPEERVRFRNLLVDLAGRRIVLLSTHIVSDVEATASRIAVLAGGRLLADGSVDTLLAAVAGQVWEWTVDAASLPALEQRHQLTAKVRRGDGVRVRAVAASAPAADAVAVEPGLEDAYLALLASRAALAEAAATPRAGAGTSGGGGR